MTQEERDKVIDTIITKKWEHSTPARVSKEFWVKFYTKHTDGELLEELLNPYNNT